MGANFSGAAPAHLPHNTQVARRKADHPAVRVDLAMDATKTVPFGGGVTLETIVAEEFDSIPDLESGELGPRASSHSTIENQFSGSHIAAQKRSPDASIS